MVQVRTLAFSLLLLACAAACAAAPRPVAQPAPAPVRTEPKARADALTMRDLSRSAPESDASLGSLKPVAVGNDSLGKQASSK